jgi:hypothetical protein
VPLLSQTALAEQQPIPGSSVAPFGTQQVPVLLQMEPLGQAGLHAPLWQTPLTHLASLVQVLPQAPQLLGSLAVSTHAPLHAAWPVGHWHCPLMQSVPLVQVLPQALQLSMVPSWVHAPLQQAWPLEQQFPLHRVWPEGQPPPPPLPPPLVQAPLTQLWPLEQTLPQLPQFLESVWRLTHLRPQGVFPEGQAPQAVFNPTDASSAVASTPPTRRSASRRETSSASAFARSSNASFIACSSCTGSRQRLS